MPRGDGTGPKGQGAGSGRGIGRGGRSQGRAGAGMPPVPAETVYARIVAKKSLITWEHPVMNSNVPSAGPP